MFRNGRTRAAVTAVVAIFILCGAVLLSAVTSAGAAAPAKLQQVPGVLPGLAKATHLGAAASGQKLEIGLAIRPRNQAAEATLQQEMYNSASPLYHHFLSVRQFKARFGVAPATTAAVRHFLTAGGLQIDYASAGGDYFTATGTVRQLDKLFSVTIGRYRYKTTSFLANNVAPKVPVALQVDGIAGLDTLRRFTTAPLTSRRIASLTKQIGGELALAKRAHATAAASSSDTELSYTAQDLWGVYNMPGASTLVNAKGMSDPATVAASTAALGQGQTMGIFIDGETSSVVDQLRLFEEAEGLPKVPVRTVETEGSQDASYGDNTGAVEWYLDSQSSTGMAPDAKQLDFYTTKGFLDADTIAQFSDWANDPNGPREMNASFGECEANPTNPATEPLSTLPVGVGLADEAEDMSEPILEQATMEGRTLFASAGDTGSGCPEVYAPVIGAGNGIAEQPVPIVGYPCASAYVVCVGGTVITSPGATYPQAAQRSSEGSWLYSGGGASHFISAPSWQQGITALDQDCVSTDDGTPYTDPTTAPLCRGVPDVADLSGNTEGDGYTIFADGTTLSEGGTSLSSPLMMGQWARIQSAASATVQNAGGLGFADPLIYKQAKGADTCAAAPCTDKTYSNDFTDITSAEDANDAGGASGVAGVDLPTTGVAGTGNGFYMDGPGWDYVSGWGALNVDHFMEDVDGSDTATDPYTGAESAPVHVCTETGTSPLDNATDPVAGGNDAGGDLTKATLTASATTVTATFTVPDYSAGVPAGSEGLDFDVYWNYGGKQYKLDASEGPTDTFSYAGTSVPVPDESTGAAPVTSASPTTLNGVGGTDPTTGTGKATDNTITITVPTTDVGSPSSGALLTDIQSLSAVTLGTIDSADNLVPYAVDGGAADSAGVDVVVGGLNCVNTLPGANTAAGTGGTSGTSTQTTTVTTTVTTPGPTTTVTKTTPAPASVTKTPPAGTAGSAATFSAKGDAVSVSSPAPVSYFYFRWQLGVSFGTTKSTAYIAKEIGLTALPSKAAIPFAITQISAPHGRIVFKATKGKVSDFTFTLKPKYLYFSYAEKAYIKKHHLKSVTGLFEIRTSKGTTYKKTLTIAI